MADCRSPFASTVLPEPKGPQAISATYDIGFGIVQVLFDKPLSPLVQVPSGWHMTYAGANLVPTGNLQANGSQIDCAFVANGPAVDPVGIYYDGTMPNLEGVDGRPVEPIDGLAYVTV